MSQGVYTSTDRTLGNGEGASPSLDVKGNTIVTPAVGASFGSSTADSSTFTVASTSGSIAMGTYNNSPDTIASGKAAALAIDSTRALVVNPKPLSKTVDSITNRVEANTYINLTASTNAIRTGAGTLVGMYVNSTSSGTIKIYDNTAQSGTVINNTITPAVGYHNLGMASFGTGLSVTIGSTLDVTLYYVPTP